LNIIASNDNGDDAEKRFANELYKRAMDAKARAAQAAKAAKK